MEQHVQNVKMQPGEQAPSPIEEKQTLTPIEKRRRMNLLLRVLGVEVALLSGFLLWATLDWSFLLMFLGVFVGALLLRSWWALLIAPVAFAIGMALGAVLLPLMQGGWPALQARMAEGFEPLDIILVFGSWLVLLSAAGGTVVGVVLGKGRKSQISKPPPVHEDRIRPRYWRLVMLLLIVVAPLATVALAWSLVLPSSKPADCGQPIDAARSGAVTQFCFPTLRPLLGQGSMTAGPDGSVWFTEGSKIARITPAGALTEFPVPPPDVFITAGPDGNLWFSGAGPQIVRVSPNGDVKEFALPKHSHDPAPLIVGPDGNLWFTEGQGVGKFAKMTLTGQITEFSLPFEVGTLAPASDGNLWVMGNGVIGRITPDGVLMTKFAVATDKIAALTAGPDGNLWFLENDGQVGRITLAGEVRHFPAFEPTSPQGGYSDIIAGPDGNLWFSAGVGQIGRITPSGVVTLFPLPPKAEVGVLAAGPDGGIWFIRSDSSDFNRAGTFWWTKIGRITP